MHRDPCLVAFGVSVLFSLATLPAQLSGTYTINPTIPTVATNFDSLAAATAALATQGVAGPVEMLLYDDAGPFTESAPFVSTSGTWTPSTAVMVLTSWTGTSPTNRVTFRPAPGERIVFDAAGRAMGVFWGGADYVTLQDVEIMNAIDDAITLYAEAAHGIAQDPIIDGCRLHDCGGTGVTIYGNTPQPANTLVQNCVLWRLQLNNNSAFNTTGRFGYVTTRRSNGTRIVHNTFIADTGTVSSFCVIGANASSTAEVPYAEVSNNIVVKTAAPGAPVLRIQTPAGSTFPVPIVQDANCWHDTSGGSFALWGPAGASVAATLLDWQIGALRDLASIEGDPIFHDPNVRDYHLHGTSPCRNASTVSAAVPADFDGQPRTGTADLGADEFSAGMTTPIGAGCPGAGGQTPVLATNWPFLGNPSFSAWLSNAPPGALTVLFGSIGLATPPIPFGAGCTIYLDPVTLTSLGVALAGPAGTSSLVFDVPANPAFVGVGLDWQSLVLDPVAPLGLTMTNAVDLVFDF
jgi:hypothetical protein